MARILVIDDDADMRNLLRLKLENAGHEIIEAQDGSIGIQLFRRQPADLVITDIFMPEKEGLELIREFRVDFPRTKIIAISAGICEGMAGIPVIDCLELAKKMGARHVFKKPLDMGLFLKTVEDVVRDET